MNKQQHKHLKTFIKHEFCPNPESIIPGCKQAVLICWNFDNLSAKPTVKRTLKNFDLLYCEIELKLEDFNYKS